MAAQEGGRFVAVSIVTLGDNEGDFSRPRPGRLTPEKKHPASIVQEAAWAPGEGVWRREKFLTHLSSNSYLPTRNVFDAATKLPRAQLMCTGTR